MVDWNNKKEVNEYMKLKQKEWREKNPERWKENYTRSHKKLKEKQKIWSKENRDKINKTRQKWRKKNRIEKNEHYKKEQEAKKRYKRHNHKKDNARSYTQKHIKIPKGQLCQDCGKRLAVEKHHEDYDKPLEVKFLCKKCHIKKEVKK